MGLLILGLGGFGAVNLSGNLRTVGFVGDKPIMVDQYYRGVQQQLQALSRNTGRVISFAEAQEIGLDRAVLAQIVAERALDHEATRIGLSIGDENLRQRVLENPSFQGLDGNFDREAYTQTLYSSGLNEGEFEETLREEISRSLLQGAVLGGVEMPDIYAQTLVSFITETRDFTWTLLDESALETPVSAPTAEQTRTYFDANPDRYILPATKKITYVLLKPEDLINDVELDEADLRAEYELRSDTYNQPERRLVERLIYADQDSADQAAAALEVGGSTFELLVEDRGLDLADVDMGDVSETDLGSAGAEVFAAESGSVVGPIETSLGPALFRVNAVLPGQNVSFEDAQDELRELLARDRAVRLTEAQAEDLDDLLAGGATIEEVAQESAMTLGQIDWTAESDSGLAAYADFRQEAAALDAGDFPQIRQLEDGSVYAMRLDEELDERPAPFDVVAEQAAVDWRADQIVQGLTALANKTKTSVEGGASFASLGLDSTAEAEQSRTAFIETAPQDFMIEVFQMAAGDVRIVEGETTIAVVRLNAINAGDDSPEAQQLFTALKARNDQELAQGLYDIFTDDTVRRAGQAIDPRALAAVNVNFH